MSNSTEPKRQNKGNDLEMSDLKGNPAKLLALHKVFFISEELLNSTSELRLERFYHPGKAKPALFITNEKKRQIQEVIEFAEPRRCWFISNNACSNGRVYITTPIDVAFLALHHVRHHCSKKALSLDSIRDDNDVSTARLLINFVSPEQLFCVADVRSVGDDMVFFKYNAEKTMAWLALKTRGMARRLKSAGVYCGHSALSHNYARSETTTEECLNDIDYLRVACDLVGDFIDVELYEELKQYLDIALEVSPEGRDENPSGGNKRKSLITLNSIEKKVKLGDGENVSHASNRESSEPEEQILMGAFNSKSISKPRSLTTKEKALAKGSKGTKNIASFFKK